MTEDYRGPGGEQTAMQHWWRHRWQYGSVLVLDVDRVIVSPSLELGLFVEEKYVTAVDKNWRVTRELAHRLGFGAALFEYATDTGGHRGTVSDIWATFKVPGTPLSRRARLDCAGFDRWVCDVMGAQLCA